MPTLYCSYKNCSIRRETFSSVTFFQFPNDERRQTWIKNSGNHLLKDLTPKNIRFLCEHHFCEVDIRAQTFRKVLSKTAVPIPYAEEQKNVDAEKNIENILNAIKYTE